MSRILLLIFVLLHFGLVSRAEVPTTTTTPIWGISEHQVEAYRGCVRTAVLSRLKDLYATSLDNSIENQERRDSEQLLDFTPGRIVPHDFHVLEAIQPEDIAQVEEVDVSVDLENKVFVRVPVLVQNRGCSFANWKANRDYRLILEHVQPREAVENRAWIEAALRLRREVVVDVEGQNRDTHMNFSSWLSFLSSIRRTNDMGGPVTTRFREPFGDLSPTVLRYIREIIVDLDWVLKILLETRRRAREMGDGIPERPDSDTATKSRGLRIAEIGVGHGAFAYCLVKYLEAMDRKGQKSKTETIFQLEPTVESYTLVDLPEVQELAYLQLNALGVPKEKVRFFDNLEILPRTSALTIVPESVQKLQVEGGAATTSTDDQRVQVANTLAGTDKDVDLNEEVSADAQKTEDAGKKLKRSAEVFESEDIVRVRESLFPRRERFQAGEPRQDLCISNYAFSELRSRAAADFYVEKVFAHCEFVALQYIPEFAPGLAIDMDNEYLGKIAKAMSESDSSDKEVEKDEIVDMQKYGFYDLRVEKTNERTTKPSVRHVVPSPADHRSTKLAIFWRDRDLSSGGMQGYDPEVAKVVDGYNARRMRLERRNSTVSSGYDP